MKVFQQLARRMGAGFNWIALVALSFMLFVVSTDILGTKFLGKPVPGAMDLLSLLGLIVIGFSTAETYRMNRHIRVTFVSRLLPARIQQAIRFVSTSLCILLFLTVVWRLLVHARDLQVHGETSITVNFPLAPFVYALGISFIPIVMILLVQLCRLLKGQDRWIR
jgi:TRAP-type C4-dicarboxylate transport system permease small subunit